MFCPDCRTQMFPDVSSGLATNVVAAETKTLCVPCLKASISEDEFGSANDFY